ncbi:hypothetical protein LWI29_033189 [Acer saccharum]|uniref:Uncharacterized protein n=1 Tax=Acer saccharum TaxID=4024 RepID=A0AA39RMX1_ACESA|nr:hypothetical protein LWI29_033189 [Acer saccharum]
MKKLTKTTKSALLKRRSYSYLKQYWQKKCRCSSSYECKQFLGRGSFGSVYFVRRKSSRNDGFPEEMAVKTAKVSKASTLKYEKQLLSNLTASPYALDKKIKFESLTDKSKLKCSMHSNETKAEGDFAKHPKNRPEAPVAKHRDSLLHNGDFASTSNQKSAPPKVSSSFMKPTDRHTKSRSVSPLKERSTNQNSGTLSSLRQKQLSARGDLKKSKRRTQSTTSQDAAQQKRWIEEMCNHSSSDSDPQEEYSPLSVEDYLPQPVEDHSPSSDDFDPQEEYSPLSGLFINNCFVVIITNHQLSLSCHN